MKYISSIENPEIKKIVRLHDKKGRTELGLFIVEGIRAIEAFFDAQWKCVHLFMTNMALESAPEAFKNIKTAQLVSFDVMKRISTASTPSGYLAVFDIPRQGSLKKLDNGIVILDMRDPGNMGTLLRSAVAFNAPIILINSCDVWSSKVVQSSAGELARAKIVHMSWQELVNQKKDMHLCALVVSGGENPDSLGLKNSILVIGGEAHGIPDSLLLECEQKLTLPMPGGSESLNAAVAGSIALYIRYAQSGR